ncbi:MAG: hypothetical protein IJN02_06490 [Bacteroidales bacterium]|nr:hypothetical protein [Bacteroidales bacterium]
MKRLFIILLALLMVLMTITGCSKNNISESTTPITPVETEPEPIMPELEYTDVTAMMYGELLGKKVETCGLPQDSIFLKGDKVVGFDYLCMGDVVGNMTCYFDENDITSYTFGSQPFDNAEAFENAFNVINDGIAGGLGQNVAEATFYGGTTDKDQMESLFGGSGIIKAEYKTADVVVTVTGCGVNNVATIVVECAAVKTEG